jgi:hypothetical protein
MLHTVSVMTPTPHSLPAFMRRAGRATVATPATLPANVKPIPATGRSRVLAELFRLLYEDFDVPRDALRPEATLAALGLKPMQWWLLHEAVLETLPHLGTHPAFDDEAAVQQSLADLATWQAPVARRPAPARRACVVRALGEAIVVGD